MDNAETNVQVFNEAVVGLTEIGADDTAQQITYLGLIAHSMACIADSLEKMSDHMTADPFEKVLDEYRKAREEELRV